MTASQLDDDMQRLVAYLKQELPDFDGPLEISKFDGGQSNPTFKLESASGTYVLRRQPSGELLKSAHAVDREFRVMQALWPTPVPVPRVLHLCTDRRVIGSMFYVMEFCDGRIFWDAELPELSKAARRPVYEAMVDVLADLHGVDVDDAGLTDFGKPGNYFERQYARWQQQYRASELEPIPAMDSLIDVLGRRLPEDDGRSALVHGDFRLDNVIFARDRAEPLAVLDWELSTLGHPFADLGYFCMQLRMPAGVGNMSGLRGKSLDELGIPDEAAIVDAYCARSGVGAVGDLGFYVAFSFFRLAAIVQGVAKRAVSGNASSERAAEVGAFVEPLAGLGLEALDGD